MVTLLIRLFPERVAGGRFLRALCCLLSLSHSAHFILPLITALVHNAVCLVTCSVGVQIKSASWYLFVKLFNFYFLYLWLLCNICETEIYHCLIISKPVILSTVKYFDDYCVQCSALVLVGFSWYVVQISLMSYLALWLSIIDIIIYYADFGNQCEMLFCVYVCFIFLLLFIDVYWHAGYWSLFKHA